MVENRRRDEEVIIFGSMGYVLLCDSEIVFSIETEPGKIYTFLASSKLTKGYDEIAIRQDAQVMVRRYTADTVSYFVDQAKHPPPNFVAFKYRIFRDRG